VEDDYDGEFRLDGAPLAALRSGAGAGAEHVFYVGTFSKCMLPSLRLGFIMAPRWAVSALVTAKNCQDWHCPVPLQAAVAAFVGEGHLARHVRRMRQVYRERRTALVTALRAHTGGRMQPIESGYGMHLAAWLPGGVDAAALERELDGVGVRLHALDRYGTGPAARPGVVLGYGVAEPGELARAMTLLGDALRRH
jgi:GntR family transcriptional regulator/MocR family aminotransferase